MGEESDQQNSVGYCRRIEWLLRKFAAGVKLSPRVVVRSVRSSGSWYLGRSRGKQILVGGVVIGVVIVVLYSLWKWCQDEGDTVPQTGSREYRKYSG